MKHPEPYDGKQDIEIFDNWVLSVTNYADIMRIRERTMIRMMLEYVTGDAKMFYLKYVAGRADEWNYQTIFPAIFDYCFPKDFMKRLRIKWNNLAQGKRRVRDYLREIEMIARKFGEMSERTLVLKFWDGLDPELREIMALMNAEPEVDDINEMAEKAEQAERSLDERTRERNRRNDVGRQGPPRREWNRYRNNRTGMIKDSEPEEKEEDSSPDAMEKIRANAISPQHERSHHQNTSAPRNPPNQNVQKKFGPQVPKLSRDKLDNLRAEGRCFNCRDKGHEQRNCPQLNSMKPPRPIVKAGAISFTRMEELAERKEQADLFVGCVSIAMAGPIGIAQKTGQRSNGRRSKKRVVDPEGATTIERTPLQIRDKTRRLPEPIVVEIMINGQPIRALLDTGSMADFISTSVVNYLRLPTEMYPKPLSVHLAVRGSRSEITRGTTVNFRYQTIDCDRRFDIADIDKYDAILGTPFMYQHQVAIGFNPSRVVVMSSVPSDMVGPDVATLSSAAAKITDTDRPNIKSDRRSIKSNTRSTIMDNESGEEHSV